MNIILYSSPQFPQPDRERILTLGDDEEYARKIWTAIDETQRLQGLPLRSARLVLNAKMKHRYDGRKNVPFWDDSDPVETFKRMSIRFLTTTQDDAFWQYYSAAPKSILRSLFAEIKVNYKIHDSPVSKAYLEEGGELLKSGIVDHGTVIDSFEREPKAKKTWR